MNSRDIRSVPRARTSSLQSLCSHFSRLLRTRALLSRALFTPYRLTRTKRVDVMGRKLAFNMASAVSMNSAFARPSRFATLFAARKFSAEITSKFVPVCVIATMERDLLMFRNIRVEPYVPRTLTNQVIVEAGREQEFASSRDFSTRCLTRGNSNEPSAPALCNRAGNSLFLCREKWHPQYGLPVKQSGTQWDRILHA
jgi:hypothetical protein